MVGKKGSRTKKLILSSRNPRPLRLQFALTLLLMLFLSLTICVKILVSDVENMNKLYGLAGTRMLCSLFTMAVVIVRFFRWDFSYEGKPVIILGS